MSIRVPCRFRASSSSIGNILDGYHRERACRELGLWDWPKVVRQGLTEAEKRAHARQLNLARRHLSQEQKRELVRQQLVETPQKSDNLLASTLGVTDKTVRVVREEMESTSEIPKLERLVGADGKERPRHIERAAAPAPAYQPVPAKVEAESGEAAASQREKPGRGVTPARFRLRPLLRVLCAPVLCQVA